MCVHVDELPGGAVEAKVAHDTGESFLRRRQGHDESQLLEDARQPPLIDGVHEQVDVARTGRPAVSLRVPLPLAVMDTFTRQRFTELPHQRQQWLFPRKRRGSWRRRGSGRAAARDQPADLLEQPESIGPEEYLRCRPHQQQRAAQPQPARRDEHGYVRHAPGAKQRRQAPHQGGDDRGGEQGVEMRFPKAAPAEAGKPQPEVGHQDVVHRERTEHAQGHAGDPPVPSEPGAGDHAQHVRGLPPRPAIHRPGGARHDVTDAVARAQENAERQDLEGDDDRRPLGTQEHGDGLGGEDDEERAQRQRDERHRRHAAAIRR